MKKILIAFLASLACICTIAAFGCKSDGGKSTTPKEYTVEFTPTENLEYICEQLGEGESTLTVKSGESVSFSVTVPLLYAVPTVYANGNPVTAREGVYTVTVTANTVITTAEVKPAAPTFTGTGTSQSPVKISTPADYIAIADRINQGNSAYVTSYYTLENDIDFGGMEIPVIGNGSTGSSLFMGNFNGKGHTLSNFKIKTDGLTYVGLFGYVISSGNNDGTGMIINLNIDNFEIEAQAAQRGAMFVGSFVGYGIASTVIACSATNGSILAYGDSSMFSYVGGAIGIQNSATLTNGNNMQFYPASASYIHTDVDIACNGGVLATGGVIGYVVSEHERAISYVINSYSEGNVSGGIYSGGVAGSLSDYSSMANCYSVSEVFANSRYQDNEIYSHAYAGGLIGYLGNGTIVSDSFAKNDYIDGSSSSGPSYVHKGELIGGYAEATAVDDKGLLFNCKSGNDVNTSVGFFKNTLYWQECDWVITEGSYPEINQEEAQMNNFAVTFDYSGKNVDGKQSKDLNISLSEAFYAPMFYFYEDEFGDTVISDDEQTSYGYYFDSEFTQKVPYGFIPTRNITLYTGFEDYGEVAGTYYLITRKAGRQITLTLNKNGTYTYYDGIEFNDFYSYNGTKLIFNNALFARLSESVTINSDGNGNSVARPDYNYNVTKFAAVKTAGNGLDIFDGSFFTEEAPLVANRYAISGEWYQGSNEYVFYANNTGKLNGRSFDYTLTASGELTINYDGAAKTGSVSGDTVTVEDNRLSKYDVFRGVWEIASNINRKYEFDGKQQSWTYTVKGVQKASGTYSIGENGVATLKTGLTAEIDASGLLLIKNGDNNEYFAKENSFSGTWIDLEHNVLLYIDGYGSSLAGHALINIGGATSELTYIMDGFFDVDGDKTITLLNGYTLYGYLVCNEDGSFTATFFSSNTGAYINGYNFYLLDTLEGDWVGEGELNGITFDSLSFNGFGIYGNGVVLLNGAEEMEYSVNDNFDGSFGDYTVEFDDETGVITLTLGSEKVELTRKDELGSYVLVADDGTKYSFNGGGKLSKGGKLTITRANGNSIELGYKIISGSLEELNLTVELYSTYRVTDSSVGTITIKNYKFEVKYTTAVAGLSDQTLTIDNPFTGTWRASGFSTSIIIGELDLSNKAQGFFLDLEKGVTFTYLPEYGCLEVPYVRDGMTDFATLYLIMLSEGNMVISSYNVITSGDNLIYCAHADELCIDTWQNSENKSKVFRFDGMADSLYTVGIAWDESGNVYLYTRRFGTYFFWSQDGETAYTIERRGDKESASMVYERTARDYLAFYDFDLESCILEVEDGDTVYEFYLTHVEVDGVEKDYTLASVNGNITELVIYENEEDSTGVRYVINHAEKTIETVD